MNQPFGLTLQALRALTLRKVEPTDMARLHDMAGLPYPGWPATPTQWRDAVGEAGFAHRPSFHQFVDFLATVTKSYASEIVITDVISDGDGVRFLADEFDTTDPDYNNRLIQTEWGVFFTGGRYQDDEQFVVAGLYWANPITHLTELTAAVPFRATLLPFRLCEPGPGPFTASHSYIGEDLTPESQRNTKGRPCVVELQLLGAFLDDEPNWPYLYEDAEEGDHDGTYLMPDTYYDEDDVGIYLVDNDQLPALQAVVDRGMLPAGVKLSVVWGNP